MSKEIKEKTSASITNDALTTTPTASPLAWDCW
jgi:hypothetical protein